MSRENHETDKLDPLAAALLRNLQRIAPEAREELLALSDLYTELFPSRPVLRLVRVNN
jgi:hypothetical protein